MDERIDRRCTQRVLIGMRIGIIAEGFADANVIKALVQKVTGCDSSDLYLLRPEEIFDETDLCEMNFSNWGLVFESCKDEELLAAFFEEIDGEALLIVHVDTAERGEVGYDVNEPRRSGAVNYSNYAETLRNNVIQKIESLIAPQYHQQISYAIAIEETDAWLIPLFDNTNRDTASHVRAKEHLSNLISADKKSIKRFVDTGRKSLDYVKLGKELAKNLTLCRKRNKSLDLFCIDIEHRFPN